MTTDDSIYADELFEELGQIAPHSPEAEVALLGSIILDDNVIKEVSRSIIPTDFYLKKHQRIYEVMLELANEGANIDYVILDALLKKKHQNDEAWGGLDYLEVLPNRISYIPSVSNYVKIIKEHSLRRVLIKISRQVIEKAYDRTLESKDVLELMQSKLLKLCQSTIVKEPNSMATLMCNYITMLNAEVDNESNPVGISTGISGLDELILGFQPGQLAIIAGRPSDGKTSLMLSITRHIGTELDKPVLIFSAEMADNEIAQNALAEISKINLVGLQKSSTPEHEIPKLYTNIKKLGEAPIWIDDTSSITVNRVRIVTRQFIEQHGIEIIFIDYLQMMSHDRSSKNSQRHEQIEETIKQLKQFARECGIPVVVLSQINREYEKRQGQNTPRKPRLSELSGSGGIENIADLVIMRYRPYSHTHKEQDKGMDVLLVTKNRRGRTGEAPVKFIPYCVRFEHREPNIEEFYQP